MFKNLHFCDMTIHITKQGLFPFNALVWLNLFVAFNKDLSKKNPLFCWARIRFSRNIRFWHRFVCISTCNYFTAPTLHFTKQRKFEPKLERISILHGQNSFFLKTIKALLLDSIQDCWTNIGHGSNCWQHVNVGVLTFS